MCLTPLIQPCYDGDIIYSLKVSTLLTSRRFKECLYSSQTLLMQLLKQPLFLKSH